MGYGMVPIGLIRPVFKGFREILLAILAGKVHYYGIHPSLACVSMRFD